MLIWHILKITKNLFVGFMSGEVSIHVRGTEHIQVWEVHTLSLTHCGWGFKGIGVVMLKLDRIHPGEIKLHIIAT